MKALLLCAAVVASIASVSEASALNAPAAPAAVARNPIVKVSDIRRHSHGGIFSNWCAYNCYRVSPSAQPGTLGRYHYSQYAYDQDLPFHYRWDRDASPIDNVFGAAYPVAGEPVMRAFERRW